MTLSNAILAESNTQVPGLIVVCGATATGKSGLAIALAQRFPALLLSADSRQVYRHFNIGTAKPTLAEQHLVPHQLIDICDPTATLTVADYQQQAQALIQQCHQDGLSAQLWSPGSQPVLPLLVGGTGLYIRAIAQGLKIPRVPPHAELRSQLQTLGQKHLYALLEQVDSTAAGKIHPHDTVRTLRALEVFYVTGRPISAQQGENPPPYRILHIGLDSPQGLDQRIERRTQQMIDRGLVAEVEGLCQTYGDDLPLLNTLGYAEIRQYLTGDISLAAAQRLTVLHTRQFAKRQRTWFRACPEIEWFDPEAPDLVATVEQRIQKFRNQPPTR
jgi:tRNA dimethylallyltransferase